MVNKKLKYMIAASVALVAVWGGTFLFQEMNKDKDAKVIHVSIMDEEGIILYDDDVKTSAATLASLLQEMEADNEIKLSYTMSEYGMFIEGLGIDNARTFANKDYYWIFTSANNKECQNAEGGFCPAADVLNIHDGDVFSFSPLKAS
ncbi:MAG: hypothetical protein ACK5KR_04910 [Breznakia sp.]